MGKQRLQDKGVGLSALQTIASITPGIVTGGTSINQLGFLPLGEYKGEVRFFDLDNLANQPLIWAEKQWTRDKVDTRNGLAQLSVPIGAAVGSQHTAEIEVPTGEVWYLGEHEMRIPQVAGLTAGDITLNFRVSSFPKPNEHDKAYYDPDDPQVYLCTGDAAVAGGSLTATQAEIAAGDTTDRRLIVAGVTYHDTANDIVKAAVKRNFRDGDELNTELRLLGGDKLTLVATVATAAVAGAAVAIYLRVWGRVGKALVQ